MIKQIFSVFILITMVQFSAWSQKYGQLLQSEQYINLAIPENVAPQPFKIETAASIEISLLIGKPFKDFPGTVYFNPAEKVKQNNRHSLELSVIGALRFYLDTEDWNAANNDTFVHTAYYLPLYIKEKISRFFAPFYFKKYEVTNAEYRQFTNWVRDSIARSLLANVYPEKYYADVSSKNLNWNTPIDWESKDEKVIEALKHLYFQENEMFFMKRELDAKSIVYTYTDQDNAVQNVPVYPDTLVWLTDHFLGFFEQQEYPMKKNEWNKISRNYPVGISERMLHYFHAKEYSHYPVTGVSYFQAKAYCHWKTRQLQNTIASKSNIQIEVDLPYDYEREYVMTSYSDTRLPDVSCLCDLIAVNQRGFYPYMIDEMLDHDYSRQIECNKASYNIHEADIRKINRGKKAIIFTDINEMNVSGLLSNVSEWMNESYQDNYLPFIAKRKELLESFNENKPGHIIHSLAPIPGDRTILDILSWQYASEISLLLGLEDLLHNYCDTDGMLVRGGNWKDNRYKPDCHRADRKNPAYKDAMTFVSPGKSGSMLGFRYVIRIKHE